MFQPNYDMFSLDFKADPFPTFAKLRETCPVYPHQTARGKTIWYVTRYDDVLTVLKDNKRVIKDSRNVHPSSTASLTPNIHQAINQNMLFADPPNHTRLRALVTKAFTPRQVARITPRIQAVADMLLDRVQTQGQMDVIADYALPLPVAVISELLGIPTADQAEVCGWAQSIISPGRYRLSYRARRQRVRAFVNYLHEMFDLRRHGDFDDLTSALVLAEQEGDKLTEAELSSMVALLIVTGHETTVNLIGNGLLALLHHPDQLDLLREQPGLIEQAVEELLRFDGPVETSTTRWARIDFDLLGQSVQAGDIIRVVLTSANRDASQFANPDQLDLTRTNNRHLAFGHGIHYCLAASLARLEGQIAIQTLLRRLPDLELSVPADQLGWHSGIIFRGMKAMPVRWPV